MKRNTKVYAIVVILYCLILIISTVVPSYKTNISDTTQKDATLDLSQEDKDAKVDKEIFPKDKVIDVKINISEKDFEDMLKNGQKEEIKVANVNYNGYEFNNIGVRTKGNSSLMQVAAQDSDRYSFKINLDEYTDGQNFYGITSINLNNNFSDPTYMREYLTYELMEQMGLPTPRFSYVNVYINNKLHGLYLAVEQVNESFINSNFEITNGNLYKPDGDGSDLIWKGESMDNYSGLNLKTNKKENDNSKILNMMKELSEGSDYEKYINVDEVLRYLAVSTVLCNFDSYQGSFKHNYYLYEENGVFSIIPWDFNMSFAGFGGMGPESGEMTEVLIDEPTMGSLEERPLIDKLLKVQEYKEKYHSYIEEIVNGYLSKENFNKRVEELSNLITNHVEKDPTKFYTLEEHIKSLSEDVTTSNSSKMPDQKGQNQMEEPTEPGQKKDEEINSNERSREGKVKNNDINKDNKIGFGNSTIVGLTSFVEARIENVRKQLDGTIPSYKDGTGIGGGKMGMSGGNNKPENMSGEFNPSNMPKDFENKQGMNPPKEGMSPQGNNNKMPMMGQQRGMVNLEDIKVLIVGAAMLILSTVYIQRLNKKRI
ncbi:putative inner spore coat protein H [Gottschalkia acidurici 9a]|uniref:Inner spore coat protein H n=1 Tax=Gottschalkia acidurici (strain ATCC 7906 / DSM 604 / BCRC 14475 / CIP 104303 / KCTC 5404 / NCIMB 10678 / 9a) TaxID=1128398 RepID=K0B4L7_GOTA9|nr:CotH kinase family protein [Gottschalkia acidurici]AFS79496.1 putative inner spore coat protein H [Gottschalkia acidurici 9a]